MAVKRRIVWMADDEWIALQAIAKDRGETVSGVIRQFWTAASTMRQLEQAADRAVGPSLDRSAQQERDAILNRVNRKTGDK